VSLHEDPGRDLSIIAKPYCEAGFMALLESTEFGTDGLRYRRLGLDEQLRRLPQAAYVELREKEQLVGTYVLATRKLRLRNEDIVGVYRGLLGLAPEARGRGLGELLVQETFNWLAAQSRGEALLAWGCVEHNNSRPRKLLESRGARHVGSLHSLLAYRQWPRSRPGVEKLTDAESIAQALRQTCADCGLQTVDHTTECYFAVTDINGIVAGARAALTHIDMLSSGGVWDFLYDKVLRRVPAARRRYDPHNFRYLRLSEVVIKPGHERIWHDFLGTLLAIHEAPMAMFVLDPRSRTCRGLREAGLFGRFTDSTLQRIDVLANSWNLPADRFALLTEKPLAIGPLDI
jgi:GNAT superfamily N-acetyltransferase